MLISLKYLKVQYQSRGQYIFDEIKYNMSKGLKDFFSKITV